MSQQPPVVLEFQPNFSEERSPHQPLSPYGIVLALQSQFARKVACCCKTPGKNSNSYDYWIFDDTLSTSLFIIEKVFPTIFDSVLSPDYLNTKILIDNTDLVIESFDGTEERLIFADDTNSLIVRNLVVSDYPNYHYGKLSTDNNQHTGTSLDLDEDDTDRADDIEKDSITPTINRSVDSGLVEDSVASNNEHKDDSDEDDDSDDGDDGDDD